MTLRQKTLLTIGLTLLCSIAVLYILLSTILLDRFAELERQDVQQKVVQVQNALSDNLTKLRFTIRDWAEWDDTYAFVQDANPTYAKTNLNAATIARLNLNLMIYARATTGEIVFATAFDPALQTARPLPGSIASHLSPNSPLFQHRQPVSTLAGIVLLPEGILMVASHPILPGSGTGEIRGSLIFGRYLSEATVETLAAQTGIATTVHRLDDPQLPASLQQIRAQLSTPDRVVAEPLSDQTIAGYTLINNIYGDPALILRVDVPRRIYQEGQLAQNYLFFFLTVVGIVFGSVTLLLLETLVLSRLSRLSSEVRQIGVLGDSSLRVTVTQSDELSQLAHQLNRMLDTLIDSQRKQRESDARYRTLVEQTSEGIFVIELNTQYLLEANAAFQQLMGYAANEIPQLRLNDIVVDAPGNIERNLKHLKQEKHLVLGEWLCRTKTQEWVTVEVSADLITQGDRQVACILVHDVTQRKHVEEALRQSEARNRALLDAIPDLIVRLKADGTYLDYKAPKDSLSNFFSKHIVGDTVQTVLPDRVAQQAMHHIQQALQTGEMQIYEYQMLVDDRMKDYEARVVVSSEQEVLAIVRDITERKKVERLKNEFVSVVSHELRTPLTSIRGALGLALGGVTGELSDDMRSLLDIACRNSNRLIQLINDILDVEKIESGTLSFRLEPVELVPLIEQAIAANRTYGEQFGVRFELQHPCLEVMVKADGDRLSQVLTNLLSNAAKFSHPDSTVDITISRYQHQIRVAVTDYGSGIPTEFHSRIFQKFAQADSSDSRQKGGTGLGLSISKAIIEKMGGQIGFETQENVGTTFYFDLPEAVDLAETTLG